MFADMPKVELHVHLDGLLSPRAVMYLAERNNLLHTLPAGDEAGISNWFAQTDFAQFFEVKRAIKRLLRSEGDFALAVGEAAHALAVQRVRYAEVTVTPYTFVDVLQHLTIDALLRGLEAGRQRVKAEYDVELRWVFDIPRNRAFADYHNGGAYVAGAAEKTLDYALRGTDYGVIALGLGGNEVNAPPPPFAPVFAEAKRHGLRSLPHAGESAGAESVWGAIDDLQADRVGHGVRAADDVRLLTELAARQLPLEVCMSSNVYLGFYTSIAEHPLPLLDRAGLLVTINSDDPMLIGTTLTREYQLLVDAFGYSVRDVIRLARNAFTASYAEPALKARLLSEFDAWAASRTL